MLLEVLIRQQFGEDIGCLTLSQIAYRRAFLGMNGSGADGGRRDCTEALTKGVSSLMANGDRKEIPLHEVIGLL